MGRFLVLTVTTVLAVASCADHHERATAQDALAFGFQPIECRGSRFDRILVNPAAADEPADACAAIEVAIVAALERKTVELTDLHRDSVASIIVDMRSIQEDRSSTDATEIGVTFDLVHENWNLIVWIRGDSILDVGGVPKGLRY